MKPSILFGLLFVLVACQPNTDVKPASLADAITGTYRTNQFLDYTRLTLATNQMPVATVLLSDDTTITLSLAQFAPQATVRTLVGITLIQRDDKHIDLRQNRRVIGSVQTGRAFTASGMETQGRLLRLADSTQAFVGYQP